MLSMHHVKPSCARAPWTPPQQISANSFKLTSQLTEPTADFYRQTEEYYATCWEWTGPVRPDSQVFVRAAGVRIPIHRFAYLLWRGDVPNGRYARPTVCETTLCVAPHHLELVGRSYSKRVLTDEQERTIREIYNDKHMAWSQDRLAKKYGVSQQHIHRVVSRLDS